MSTFIKSDQDFERFFKEFYPAVYAFMQHYTGDAELSADLTQDVFLRVYEQREKIVSLESAKAFLYTVGRYLYWNHCKHERARERYMEQLQEDEEDDYDFLSEVTKEETIRLLYAAIDKLPPQTRRIILLNLDGKNNDEIAEELSVTVNTVKTLKQSAYSALRKMLTRNLYLLLITVLGN